MEVTSRYSIDINDINTRNSENVYRLIQRGEDAYNQQVRDIADDIIRKNKKIVLITGPSSSGKTTSSYKLKKMLAKQGVKSFVVNMDDFFKDLSTVPLREDGKPDMEGIVALDVKCVRNCLNEILLTGKTQMPTFDFATHKRTKKWKKYVVEDKSVIIMEGIHALNPVITKGLDKSKIYKVYVHCNTNFTYNDKILFFARELRLIRRLVRDERERNVPFQETIDIWQDVCNGEENNIRPYKDRADYLLNSTHYYEPLLYKFIILEKLMQIKNQSETVKLLIEKFRLCATINSQFIPKDSLIREFIGEDN